MSEEIFKIYRCEACTDKREIEVKPGFLGTIRNPKPPQGWDTRNNVQMCTSCIQDHDTGYKQFFAGFLEAKKKLVKRKK